MFNRMFRGRGGQGGRGVGRGGRGQGRGGGKCVCPSCGHKAPHQAGQRCIDLTCPECGTKMIRE